MSALCKVWAQVQVLDSRAHAWQPHDPVRLAYTDRGNFNSREVFEHPYVPTPVVEGGFRLFRCSEFPAGRHAAHQCRVREEDYQKLRGFVQRKLGGLPWGRFP